MSILERVRILDKKYHFVNTFAKSLDAESEGKLSGYTISVKDNICVKGMQSTAGSRILDGYIPPFDATVIVKCKREGGSILCKTTQDEFGFGTFNVNTPYGIPLNPHDPERSTGGSSGGAACLTALADFPHLALSESTGGSISCPAAWCGVVGITPTYGRVSRWGLIDYANSLDKLGVMAKTVKEASLLLQVISGPDNYDSTTLKKPVPCFSELDHLSRIRIGVPKEYMGEGVDSKIEETVWSTLKKLESKGAKISDVSLPYTKYSLSSYYIIAMAEASTNLAKFCGLRYGLQEPMDENFKEYFSKVRAEGLGAEAKRRIMLGTFTRMKGYRDAYYLKALKVRTRIIEDFKRTFKSVDIIAAPTMPVLAPRFDEIELLEPIQHYMMDILTAAPNLAGIPMVSIPCGEISGLPVGLHLMADHLEEYKMLQTAREVELL